MATEIGESFLSKNNFPELLNSQEKIEKTMLF